MLMSLCVWNSCSYHKAEMPDICTPPKKVSFQEQIIPIFNQHCNTSACHAGKSPAGNLNLEASLAYEQLLNKKAAYIDTVVPEQSLLYAQMRSASNPMPPDGRLDECTTRLILQWIKEKAKNN